MGNQLNVNTSANALTRGTPLAPTNTNEFNYKPQLGPPAPVKPEGKVFSNSDSSKPLFSNNAETRQSALSSDPNFLVKTGQPNTGAPVLAENANFRKPPTLPETVKAGGATITPQPGGTNNAVGVTFGNEKGVSGNVTVNDRQPSTAELGYKGTLRPNVDIDVNANLSTKGQNTGSATVTYAEKVAPGLDLKATGTVNTAGPSSIKGEANYKGTLRPNVGIEANATLDSNGPSSANATVNYAEKVAPGLNVKATGTVATDSSPSFKAGASYETKLGPRTDLKVDGEIGTAGASGNAGIQHQFKGDKRPAGLSGEVGVSSSEGSNLNIGAYATPLNIFGGSVRVDVGAGTNGTEAKVQFVK